MYPFALSLKAIRDKAPRSFFPPNVHGAVRLLLLLLWVTKGQYFLNLIEVNIYSHGAVQVVREKKTKSNNEHCILLN
jgi:hypothetical protein